jgi:hypothetical protein
MGLQRCITLPLFNYDKRISHKIILSYHDAIKAFNAAIKNADALLKAEPELIDLDFLTVYNLEGFYLTDDHEFKTVKVATDEECEIQNGDGDSPTWCQCAQICYCLNSYVFFMRFYVGDDMSEYTRIFNLKEILSEIETESFKLKLNAQG